MASKSSKRRRKRRRAAAARGSDEQPSGSDPSGPDPSGQPAREASAPKRASRRRSNIDDEPPPAPWGSFPLVELAVLVGIVMLILGLTVLEGERGVITIVTGLLLASIGGLELSIREHFAGYRSHTLVLSGVPAAAVLGLLFYAGPESLSSVVRAAIGLAVFAAAAVLLTRIFRDRSGGYSFRFSGLRKR